MRLGTPRRAWLVVPHQNAAHCGADNVNTIGWLTAAPQRPSAARYNIDANGSEYTLTQLPWPALLVQFRRLGVHARNTCFRLSSCDEHKAVVQSCCRMKEARGSHRACRREHIGCRIEYFAT